MSAIYETDKLLAEYLLFHYGADDEILPPDESWPDGMRAALGFPVRTVRHFQSTPAGRGLDLGCAVGRSACEMARSCGEVVGIDFSHTFIRAAAAIAGGAALPYQRTEEGSGSTPLEAILPAGVDGVRLDFRQGDAMDLPEDLGVFDRVHAANLLCRLPRPGLLLGRLPSLVKPGGELVLATPCTWLEEFTPLANWPRPDTFGWLKEMLEPSFTLMDRTDEPFLIRETARKFQWTRSLLTVWRRNG
ncbi:MAG: methyltransferase domain-containing protein [Akkermansiaceae bacterium]|nr:methyltransferase domain-containing protein [Akkermansiaceae bacterium]MCP5543678.1 methyltransferase domain-containing protein [Akkermansiaceae bacterium]MCP5547245.1 methyltransferase domain-containing protein [Akkermansiaceae bacterium]